jgi:hypothetical protein
MEGLTGSSLGVFIGLTLVIGGGTAALTGQAIAGTWRPVWQLVFACLGLGLADRFLVFALFSGPLFSLVGYLVDTAVILVIGLVAYRLAWVKNMVRQYPWLHERVGLWRYRRRR